jgi:hypothetical protein
MELNKNELKVGMTVNWAWRQGAGFARYTGVIQSIECGGEEVRVRLTRAAGTAKPRHGKVGETILTSFGGGTVWVADSAVAATA